MNDDELLQLILTKLDKLDSRIDRIESHMATKEELAALRADTKAEFAALRAEMATKEDVAQLDEKTMRNVLSVVNDNLLPVIYGMEEHLSTRLDDLTRRLNTVEIVSSQNSNDIARMRRAE